MSFFIAAQPLSNFNAYQFTGVPATINMIPNAKNSFENAFWTKTNIQDTTFATKTTAPDGTSTAEKVIANVTNGNHAVDTTIIAKSAVPQKYRYSIDAKAGEYTRLALLATDIGTNFVYIGCDLSGGQIAYGPTTFGSGLSATNLTVTPIGNGFYRFTMDVTTNNAASFFLDIQLDNGSGTAAESRSFAGNGVNGVYVWQVNVLPVSAWSLINTTFKDNFNSLSTIDIKNTKAKGFNWYVNNAWPNAGDGGSQSTNWRTAGSQQTGDFSTTGSSVTATIGRAGNGIDQTLTSAVTDGSTGYIGRVFTPPMYFESTWAFDPTLSTLTAGSWPIQWAYALEYLTGASTRPIENDMFEAFRGNGTISADTGVHDWTISGSSATSNVVVATTGLAALSLTYTAQNRYGYLWLSQSANGGTNGLRQTYVNGVYVSGSEISYSSAGISAPAATPSNPSGVFSAGDTQHFPLMLSAGSGAGGVGNWPVTWTNAVVYQQGVPIA